MSRRGRARRRVAGVPLTDESVVAGVAEADERVLARWAAGRGGPRAEVLRALRRRRTPRSADPGPGRLGDHRCRHLRAAPRAHRDPGAAGARTTARWPARCSPSTATTAAAARGCGCGPASCGSATRSSSAAARQRVTEVGVSEPGGVLVGECRPGRPDRRRARTGRADRRHPRDGRPRRRTHRFPPATLQALVEPEDPTPAHRALRRPHRARRRGPAHRPAARRGRRRGRGEPARRGAEGGDRRAAGGALRRPRPLPGDLRGVPGARGRRRRRRSTGSSVGDNPYLAGIGLRVEAAPVGHGVEFSPGIERGNLPPAFIAATEEGVRAALRQGLRGWAVTDCVVTMTESGYWPRQSRPHQKFDKSISSVAADFRHLAPVVLMAALARGGDPGVPAGRPVRAGGARRAVRPGRPRCWGGWARSTLETSAGGGYTRLVGHLPAEGGAATWPPGCPTSPAARACSSTRLDHHAPVTDRSAATRRRHGSDPLDRASWFRAMLR